MAEPQHGPTLMKICANSHFNAVQEAASVPKKKKKKKVKYRSYAVIKYIQEWETISKLRKIIASKSAHTSESLGNNIEARSGMVFVDIIFA